MGKTNKIENIFLKYLLKFMEEEIHGADFDLMQSMNQTKSVGKKWFDANRDKIRRELKKENKKVDGNIVFPNIFIMDNKEYIIIQETKNEVRIIQEFIFEKNITKQVFIWQQKKNGIIKNNY